MKDLFVLTADSDAQALIQAVLRRHQALQISPISFEVRRFPGRDSGMVKEGPEIARAMVQKGEYSRLILVWDHHGSGWHKLKAAQAVVKIQERLDGVTWTNRSAAVVVVPEMEEWLWHCPASVAGYLGSNAAEFEIVTARAATRLGRTRDRCYGESPKELFEAVLYDKKRRKPLPEDFAALGSSADVTSWCRSETFARFVAILRAWFPAS
ncbi:MAG TPA: hypothetical protein VNY05_25530 [Candidatus Acidoferrales bacterium]|jgi:hypothetical protein|nr:hypothetical protein [Candidatus Acidoferrales bacterium]